MWGTENVNGVSSSHWLGRGLALTTTYLVALQFDRHGRPHDQPLQDPIGARGGRHGGGVQGRGRRPKNQDGAVSAATLELG